MAGYCAAAADLRSGVRGLDAEILALVDAAWYLQTYPDVAGGGAQAGAHFEHFGMAEGRDPGPWFESDWYLRRYHDVDNAGLLAFGHYLDFGLAEGRYPNPQWERRDLITGASRAPRSTAELTERIAIDSPMRPAAAATTYPHSWEANLWARLAAARVAGPVGGGQP